MSAGDFRPACPAPPASLSTTVKPGNFRPALPASPAFVSSIKPIDLVSLNNILPHPKSPPEPARAVSPRELFAQYYDFSLPPQPEDPIAGYCYEREGGLVRPNPYTIKNPSLSTCTSSCQTDGSTRPFCGQKLIRSHTLHPAALPTKFRGPSPHHGCTSFTPTFVRPLDHDELLAKFNEQFIHSQLHRQSLESVPSRRKAPLTRGGRSFPLAPAVRHDHNGFNRQDIFTLMTFKQLSFTARPWSYDNVKTYPVMKLPAKKEKRTFKIIFEGEEKELDIEVEVYEAPKKLFNFAPKVVLQ